MNKKLLTDDEAIDYHPGLGEVVAAHPWEGQRALDELTAERVRIMSNTTVRARLFETNAAPVETWIR
jgi:hypothetical protein